MYYAIVTLHVFAAVFWLGGTFFLAAVGAPVLRTVEPPTLRAQLFRAIGRAFRPLAWLAIAILLATGVANLGLRGLLRPALEDGSLWQTPYGHALAAKLACVVLMIVLAVLHDFVIGPMASRVQLGTPEAKRLARGTAWVARANVGLGVALLIAAVRLARGG